MAGLSVAKEGYTDKIDIKNSLSGKCTWSSFGSSTIFV